MSYTYDKNSKFTLDRTHLLPTDSDSISTHNPNPISGQTMGGSIMGAYAQSVPANGTFTLDIPISTITTANISTESSFGYFLHGVVIRVVAAAPSSDLLKPRNTHMIRNVNYFFLDENGNPTSFTNNGPDFLESALTASPSGTANPPTDIMILTSPGFTFLSPNKIRFSYKALVAHVGSAHYIIF